MITPTPKQTIEFLTPILLFIILVPTVFFIWETIRLRRLKK